MNQARRKESRQDLESVSCGGECCVEKGAAEVQGVQGMNGSWKSTIHVGPTPHRPPLHDPAPGWFRWLMWLGIILSVGAGAWWLIFWVVFL